MAWDSSRFLGDYTYLHCCSADSWHPLQYFAISDWGGPQLHHQYPAGQHFNHTIIIVFPHHELQAFGWLVRQTAEVENNFNSVERIVGL